MERSEFAASAQAAYLALPWDPDSRSVSPSNMAVATDSTPFITADLCILTKHVAWPNCSDLPMVSGHNRATANSVSPAGSVEQIYA